MKTLIALSALLAACGDGPTCADAITKLATRIGKSDTPEVAMMIGTCELKKWPADVRRCVADAAAPSDVVTCVKPVLDDGAREAAEAKRQLGDAPVPSDATKAAATTAKLRVIAFFPKDSAVLVPVKAYFQKLGIEPEVRDRMVDAELSTKYKAFKDGWLVLIRDAPDGERFQTIEVSPEPAKASYQLRRLDREVSASITKLMREKRKVYITTGHGEINDRASVPPELQTRVPERRTESLMRLFPAWNFEIKTLAPLDPIPDDATLVAVLGPLTPFGAPEQAAIQSHLDRGGALLLAYDPTTVPIDALDKKLGVRALPGHLVDDKSFLNQRGSKADHRIVVTNKYETHPATIALTRSGQGSVFLDASALEVTSPAKAIVKTMDTAFIDTNENFELDGTDKRQSWPLIAAVEGSGAKPFRAIVVGDVDLFADALTQSSGHATVIMIGAAFTNDAIRWLGGDEKLVAEVVDEPPPIDDKTKQQAERERSARDILRALEGVVESTPSERDSAIRELQRKSGAQAPAKPEKK